MRVSLYEDKLQMELFRITKVFKDLNSVSLKFLRWWLRNAGTSIREKVRTRHVLR